MRVKHMSPVCSETPNQYNIIQVQNRSIGLGLTKAQTEEREAKISGQRPSHSILKDTIPE